MVARRAFLAVALALLLVVSASGSAAATNSEINYDAGPNPYIEEDQLTIAEHDRDSMGVLDYYDDEGGRSSWGRSRSYGPPSS